MFEGLAVEGAWHYFLFYFVRHTNFITMAPMADADGIQQEIAIWQPD